MWSYQMQMKTKAYVVFFFLSSLLPASYASSFARGNDIYPACYDIISQQKKVRTADEAADYIKTFTFCTTAAATSFDDITTVGYTWAASGTTAACIGDYYGFPEFSALQVLDMVTSYLAAHPKYRNLRIGEIIALILHDKYPIPKECKNL